jgi:3-aminobutyryl-CoA ammonia-lyase
VRVSEKDVHYAGGLVNGAWVLSLFGDVAKQIAIRYDGDEGLLRAYGKLELLAPGCAGDFIEALGRIVKVGNAYRTLELEAKKFITSANIPGHPSAADVLEDPIVIARGTIVNVVTKDAQRYG